MSLKTPSHTRARKTKSPGAPPPPIPPMPPKPEPLPRWIEVGQQRTATLDELLLYAMAGGKGERHRERPVVAIAERHAARVNALRKLLGEKIDDQDVADLLQETGEQADVLAVLVARGI